MNKLLKDFTDFTDFSFEFFLIRFYQAAPQHVREISELTEFVLKGSPFSCSGNESIETRQLVCRLIEALATRGWLVVDTLNLFRNNGEKTVFIFQRTVMQGKF
jgi:hypothetical protein